MYIIRSKTKEQRAVADKRAYHNELERKKRGIYNAIVGGNAGSTEEFPDLGNRYWGLRDEQVKNYEEKTE